MAVCWLVNTCRWDGVSLGYIRAGFGVLVLAWISQSRQGARLSCGRVCYHAHSLSSCCGRSLSVFVLAACFCRTLHRQVLCALHGGSPQFFLSQLHTASYCSYNFCYILVLLILALLRLVVHIFGPMLGWCRACQVLWSWPGNLPTKPTKRGCRPMMSVTPFLSV